MYLDEGAQGWLADIEVLHNNRFDLEQAKLKAQRSVERCASPAGKVRANAALAAADAALTAVNEELVAETDNFFKRVLNVTKDTLVALHEPNGKVSKCLVASHFSARMLYDKSAVFTVHGASMATTLHTGVPHHDILTARESMDQRLVPEV